VRVSAGAAVSPAIRRSMQSNRGRDTMLELMVRRHVHRMGLRYRVNARIGTERPVRADMVFAKARLAVFLDGCFWHCCPLHGSVPKSNREFWQAKLEANLRRDHETAEALRHAGWTVLRIWSHVSPADSAAMIFEHVRRPLSDGRQSPTGQSVSGTE
jgi:DNA mismatch endonuclease (patch repair protein)